jgi:hypothetical protein
MLSIFRMIYNWYSILDKKDANNIISRHGRFRSSASASSCCSPCGYNG